MATLTLAYAGKCSGDHIWFDVKLNGTTVTRFCTTQDEMKTARGTKEEAERFGVLILSAFCRRYMRDNPSATLAQLRTAIEAQEWVI